MGDFLAFRRMLMPLLIQLIFWVSVLACIGGGVYIILATPADLTTLVQTYAKWASPDVSSFLDMKLQLGIALAIGGPFVLRLVFELILLPFRINATLTEIRRAILNQSQKPASQPISSQPVPIEPAPVRVRR